MGFILNPGLFCSWAQRHIFRVLALQLDYTQYPPTYQISWKVIFSWTGKLQSKTPELAPSCPFHAGEHSLLGRLWEPLNYQLTLVYCTCSVAKNHSLSSKEKKSSKKLINNLTFPEHVGWLIPFATEILSWWLRLSHYRNTGKWNPFCGHTALTVAKLL